MAMYPSKKKSGAITLDGDATEANVLYGKTFYSDSNTKKTGTMANRSSWTSLDNKADAFTTKNVMIPEGYHNGVGRVQLASLSSQTGVDSGKTAIDASHVLTGYQGWVNGATVTGSMTNVGKQTIILSASSTSAPITKGYHDGTGFASAVESTVKKNSGSNLNTGSWSASLNAGDSVAVTAGLVYAGSVTANSLASQTGVDSGKTAIDASHVVSGYQGWVNGNKVSGSYTLPSGTKDNTGTPLTTNGDHTITGLDSYAGVKVNVNVPVPTLDGDAVAGNVLSGKTFYSDSTTKLTGTMTNRGHVVQSYLPCGNIFTIPEGYHDGTGYVQAANLSTQTRVESGKIAIDASHVLDGYQGWVNGTRITGTYSPTATETLLWQNSSTSTELGNTTVTLSESLRDSNNNPKFDYIKFVTLHYPPTYMKESNVIIALSDFFECVEGSSVASTSQHIYVANGENMRKVFYISDTQIKFTGKDGGTTKTCRVLPYKIYGVKY